MSTEENKALDALRQLIEETNKAAGVYGQQVLCEQGDMKLKEGVKEEDFERFWLEECVPHIARAGVKGILLKVDRSLVGDHIYRSLWLFPSVAWRDRLFSPPHTFTPFLIGLLGEESAAVRKKVNSYITGYAWTHYVVLDPKGTILVK